MRQEQPGRGDPIGLPNWRKILPFEPTASSNRLGWVSLEVARFRPSPSIEFTQPALTPHMLALFARPREELALRYEGVKRHVPPPAGAVSLVPAGGPAWLRSSGSKDQLHVFLEP